MFPSNGVIKGAIKWVKTPSDDFKTGNKGTAIFAIRKGIYGVSFGLFGGGMRNLELLLNGNSIMVSKKRSIPKDEGESGAGISYIDFLEIEENDRIEIFAEGKWDGQGFLEFRKVLQTKSN